MGPPIPLHLYRQYAHLLVSLPHQAPILKKGTTALPADLVPYQVVPQAGQDRAARSTMCSKQVVKDKVESRLVSKGILVPVAWNDSAKVPRPADSAVLQIFFSASKRQHLFQDFSAPLRAELQSLPPESVFETTSVESSVQQKAAGFRANVEPVATSARTRAQHFSVWMQIISWAVAMSVEACILPMSKDVLRALIHDLACLGCSGTHQKAFVNTIQDRHRQFGLMPPLSSPNDYKRFVSSIIRAYGHPSKLTLPVPVESVKAILALPYADWSSELEILAVALGFVSAMRPIEVAQLRFCQFRFGADFNVHPIARFRDTAVIFLPKRKQDQERKGHSMRVGRSQSERYDILGRLLCCWPGLSASSYKTCPAAKLGRLCSSCPPVFPKTSKHGAEFTPVPQSADWYCKAVRKHIGALFPQPNLFSGKSTRSGAISHALDQGVPEHLVYLQSGHGRFSSGRTYVRVGKLQQLYSFYDSFTL